MPLLSCVASLDHQVTFVIGRLPLSNEQYMISFALGCTHLGPWPQIQAFSPHKPSLLILYGLEHQGLTLLGQALIDLLQPQDLLPSGRQQAVPARGLPHPSQQGSAIRSLSLHRHRGKCHCWRRSLSDS